MLTDIKRALALVLVILVMLSICACTKTDVNETTQQTENTDTAYTFTDSTGVEVTLGKKPQTVAVLFSSYAEIWMLSGGTAAITVGESLERGFADENAILVDEKSGHSTIDMETLVASAPDLVIGTADYECQVEAVEFCRRQDIPAAAFTVENYKDYLSVLRIFCDINENEDAYVTYGQAVGDRIETLLARVNDYCGEESEKPNILFIRAGSSASSTKAKTADDNFVCAMLSDLITVNIADGDEEITGNLSTEAILVADPDYMFITTMGDETAAKDYFNSVLTEAGWKDLDCVKNGNFTFLPKNLFHYKPNSAWAEAYEYLINILYPEVSLD